MRGRNHNRVILIVVFFLCLVLGPPIVFCLGFTSVVAVYMSVMFMTIGME